MGMLGLQCMSWEQTMTFDVDAALGCDSIFMATNHSEESRNTWAKSISQDMSSFATAEHWLAPILMRRSWVSTSDNKLTVPEADYTPDTLLRYAVYLHVQTLARVPICRSAAKQGGVTYQHTFACIQAE